MMDITTNRADLLAALQLCASVVEKRSTIPILQNVKLETRDGELRIVATDLDVTVSLVTPATARSEGGITIQAKPLLDAVKCASDEHVSLSVEENMMVKLKCGTASFKLHSLPLRDFPTEPEMGSTDSVEFDGDGLRAALKSSSYSMTAEETRFSVNSVYVSITVGGVDFVSTDGHRMAIVTLRGRFGKPQQVLLPKKLVRSAASLRAETLRLSSGDSHVSVEGDGIRLIARTNDVNFPNYREVLAADLDATVCFDRARALALTRRALTFANETTRAVLFTVTPGRLTAIARDPELGESSDYMAVDYSGEPVSIGLSGHYFVEALQAITTDSVTLALKDERTQCQLRPEVDDAESDAVHVIMPMHMR